MFTVHYSHFGLLLVHFPLFDPRSLLKSENESTCSRTSAEHGLRCQGKKMTSTASGCCSLLAEPEASSSSAWTMFTNDKSRDAWRLAASFGMSDRSR